MKICPYKVGAKVRLKNLNYKPGNAPDCRLPLEMGKVGRIKEIMRADRRYVRIGKDNAWWHWTMFELVEPD